MGAQGDGQSPELCQVTKTRQLRGEGGLQMCRGSPSLEAVLGGRSKGL